MSRYRIEDATPATLKGTRKTQSEGFLIADAFVARPGIQVYKGSEVGFDDMETVRIYRPESEVRDANSLRSFSHAPVTIGHPTEDVTAKNWKTLAVGEVSTDVTWQDNKIKIPLVLKDEAAITSVESGTRELSPGYTADIVRQTGVTPEGEPFDGIQQNIRVNHLAIVAKGRSGPEVRIGDQAEVGVSWGAAPINDAAEENTMNLRKMLVDGLTVETTDAGAQAIEKLQGSLTALKDSMESRIAELEAERDRIAAERDTALAAKVTDEAMAAQVAARAELLGRAKTIVKDALPATLSDADIRRKAVAAKLGDAAIVGKSDAYIEVRFDDLVAQAASGKPDAVLRTVADAAPNAMPSGDDGWASVTKANGYI